MTSNETNELISEKELRNKNDLCESIRRDCHIDDIRENKEDITLIWLDEQIDDSIEFIRRIGKLRELNDYILLYTNPQLCINYIEKVVDEKIILIIDDKLSKTVLPKIISYEAIVSILIYSTDSFLNDFNLNQYSKDIKCCKGEISLIKSIENSIQQILKQTITFSLCDPNQQNIIRDITHNPGSLLWFHLLIDVLKHFQQTNQAKQQLIDVCKRYYQTNSRILLKITEFEDKYQCSDAILWYTDDSFIYRLMNKALRIDDGYLLYLIRFYIIDLSYQIEIQSKNKTFLSDFKKLYRGQLMEKSQFENLRSNIGNLISPNGFFSTSKDINIALIYAGQESHQFKSILFEINIDQTNRNDSWISFADIEKFSRFPSEKEVLFNIGSTFKIDSIQYDNQLKNWRVQLILTSQGLDYIQQHINSIRIDLTETNPTRLFGKILIDMGQYPKAETYYKLVLQSLDNNHEDCPSLYHGLGYIYYLKGNYSKAIEYDTIGYHLRKQTLPENHLDIARSALNLGCDHVRHGNHHIGAQLLEEALEIRLKNYSGQDHQNIAIVLAAIGDNAIHLADYQKALDCLTKALEIFKRVLPSEHAKIASTLMKLGYFYEKQMAYDQALQYYLDAHNMAEKVMRSDHPTLLKYFQRIIRFYTNIDRIDEARQFSIEKLLSQRQSLGDIHPNIAQIHILIGDLTNDTQQKLENYCQVMNILEKCYPKDEQTILNCQNKIDTIQSIHNQEYIDYFD